MILGEDGIATAADAISDIEPKVEKWGQMVDLARNGKSNIWKHYLHLENEMCLNFYQKQLLLLLLLFCVPVHISRGGQLVRSEKDIFRYLNMIERPHLFSLREVDLSRLLVLTMSPLMS